jgi:hypothetical protein
MSSNSNGVPGPHQPSLGHTRPATTANGWLIIDNRKPAVNGNRPVRRRGKTMGGKHA